MSTKMSVVAIYESRFLRELFAWLYGFQKQINLEISREKIEIVTMDKAHISLIRLLLDARGALAYQCSLGEEGTTVGIELEHWVRVLKAITGACEHVRISFSHGGDSSKIEAGIWNADRKKFDTVHCGVIGNIELSTDRLQPPRQVPWIAVSLDSKLLRREVSNRLKMKPDTLSIEIVGEMVKEAKKMKLDPDEIRRQLMPNAEVKTEKKQQQLREVYVPSVLLVRSKDHSIDLSTEFSLSKSATSNNNHGAEPGWKSGMHIEVAEANSEEEEEEEGGCEEEGGKKKEPKKILSLAGLDELEAAAPSSSSKRHDRSTLGYTGVLVSVKEDQPLCCERCPNNKFEFSPGCLNNVTTGAAFSHDVRLEIYDTGILRVVYDMEKRGQLECYIASKLAENN